MKASLWSAVCVAVLGASSTGIGPGEGKDVLTVEQVFGDKVTGKVRIEFTVRAVSLGGSPFSMEEATNRQRVAAEDGTFSVTRLQVIVAREVEARLNQLGIDDLQTHFYGKSVRVSGDLKRDVIVGDDGNKLITYSLTIDRLEQLEVIAKRAPATRIPGPGGGR